FGHAPGIETTTGPLGQGLANAVGMALAERHLRARFGAELVDHRTWVIASDGDLMEGISHEACSLAGHQRLDRLIVLYDDNQISIDGPTSLATSDDTLKRFEAYGWHTDAVDGHDPAAIEAALAEAEGADRPSLIACRTTIGYGAPNKAGTAATHGAPLGTNEVAAARGELGWPHPPFEIPPAILETWRGFGARGAAARAAWQERLATRPAELAAESGRVRAGARPGRARGLAGASRDAAGGAGRRVRAGAGGRSAGRPRGGAARAQAALRRGAAELGDAQGQPRGARGLHPGDAGDGRRLGRPHRL